MQAFYEIDSDNIDDMELTVRVTATVSEWRDTCEWLHKLRQEADGKVGVDGNGYRMLTMLTSTYKEVQKRAMGGFEVGMQHAGRNADAVVRRTGGSDE